MKEIIVFGLSDTIGGVENYLLILQKQLEQQVRFLFFAESGKNMYAEQIISHHGEMVYIPREEGIRVYIRTLHEKLKEYRKRTDTIYLNVSNYSHERLILLRFAKRLNYKVIIHSHAAKLNRIERVIHRMTHQMIKQLSLRYVDDCVRLAVSQRAGRFLYGNRSFQVLSPGIDLNRFIFDPQVRENHRAQHHCGNRFVVGFVGRMVEIKNPEFAIDVFHELCQIVGKEKALLMMIGDGTLLEAMKQKAAALELKAEVLFLGASDQVNRDLQAMDCLIGTSLSEGMPLNIMEAQAAGLPVICARDRYPREIAVSSLVKMIPLEVGAKAWAEEIVSIMNQEQNIDRAKRLQDLMPSLTCFDQIKVAQSLYEHLTSD